MAYKKDSYMLTYHDYYSRLKNIALSIYKWEGLPKTCNARFLEDTLFHYGIAIFVKDENMSFLNLRAAQASTLNVYNEPTAYTAFSTGYNKIYNADNCVIIRNNPMERSTDITIQMYAERLTRLEMAMGVNINAQKTPILIRCDEKTKTSLKMLYKDYHGDEPVIFATKALQEKPLEVLKTDAPFVVDKLRSEKVCVWNEALEFLGINTNPSDKKKERLIIAEVDSNNEQIDIQSLTMLATRQKACEEINKKYGLDVKISLRVEELKSLWDYGMHLHGQLPEGAVSGIIKNQEEIEHGKPHH